jgi:phenylacetyl-CoA:acceptor oxidoreductase 26-kDa subunit
MMSRLQTSWDLRAAANFMLGGAGSGLLVFSALFDSPLSVLLGLALIAAGLGAVWLEIGRKLRALHVLFNPFTSWMTRESFAALLVFLLGFGAFFVAPAAPLASLAALAFLYCQARILRAAKGIAAWRAPEVVPLILFTGLAEGAGLALFFDGGDTMLALFAAAVLVRAYAWRRYRQAVRSPALELPGRTLVWAGTGAALALLLVVPQAAGALALATGMWLKLALVTRASFNQGFSLPHLPVRGTR